jgi:Ni,Fe-hydrogenase III small subunit
MPQVLSTWRISMAMGIPISYSPRGTRATADLLPVTGPVTRNRELALCKTYDAIGYEIESQP